MSSKGGATALACDCDTLSPRDTRCVLFVSPQRSKFPENLCSRDIFTFFRSKLGKKVVSAFICQRKNKRSKGYARVKLISNAAAREAISQLSGYMFQTEYPLYLGFEREPEIMEVLFNGTIEHSLFLRYCFFENDSDHLLPLKQLLPAKLTRKLSQLYFRGYESEVRESKDMLKRYLARLHTSTVSYQCPDRQVYQSVLRDGYIPGNVVQGVTCIVQSQPPATLSVHLFGQDNGQLQATTKRFQELKPQSEKYILGLFLPQNQQSLDQQLASSLKDHNTICTRINSQVIIYGLRISDIETSWRAIQMKMNSFTGLQNLSINLFQLKYLDGFQGKRLRQIKSSTQCKVHVPSLPKSTVPLEKQYHISVEGTLSDGRLVVDQLKALVAQCVLVKCHVECPKYLSIWKKRWDSIKAEQKRKFSVIMEVKFSESKVYFEIYGPQPAVQRAQTQLISNENGKNTKTHFVELSAEEFPTFNANFANLDRQMAESCSVCLVQPASATKTAAFAYPSTANVDITAVTSHLKSLITGLASVRTAKHIHITDVVLVEAFKSAKRQKFSQYNETLLLNKNGTATIQLEGEPALITLCIDQLLGQLKDIKANQISCSTFPVKYKSIALSSEMRSRLCDIEKRTGVSCYVPMPKSNGEVLQQIEMKQNGLCCTVQLSNGDIFSENVDAVIVPIADAEVDSTSYRAASEIVKVGGEELKLVMEDLTSKGRLIPGTALECSCENLPFHTVIFAVVRPQKLEHTWNQAFESALEIACKSNFGSVSIASSLLSVNLEASCKFLLQRISVSIQSTESFMHTVRIIPQLQSSSTPAIADLFLGGFRSTDLSLSQNATHDQWFWKDDNEKFVKYNPEVASKLTKLWQENSSGSVVIQINAHTYVIDLANMQQRNISTSKLRDIKHRVVAGSTNETSVDKGSAVQWLFQDDTGSFSPYNKELSKLVEQMYQSRSAQLIKMERRKWTYKLDFKKMTQTNIGTKTCRVIQRHLPSMSPPSHTSSDSSSFYIGIRGRRPDIEYATTLINTKLESLLVSEVVPLPYSVTLGTRKFKAIKSKHEHLEMCFSESQISLKGDKESVNCARIDIQTEIIAQTAPKSEYPAEWVPQTSPCVLNEVNQKCIEWSEIESNFKATMSGFTVTSIKRVQNQLLWGRYRQEKETIEKKNGGEANEKLLFHGSRGARAEDIVDSDNGLDMRVSSTGGMWGVANYFAVKASYSDTYAHELPSPGASNVSKEMIVAKVITGDSVSLVPDHSLRMPPEKPTRTRVGGVKKQRYDTVNGVTNGSAVYMTYDNAKAYPAYILTYNKTPASSFFSSLRKKFGF